MLSVMLLFCGGLVLRIYCTATKSDSTRKTVDVKNNLCDAITLCGNGLHLDRRVGSQETPTSNYLFLNESSPLFRMQGGIVKPRLYVPPPSIMALVVLLALGWGINWPIMKVVMAEMPPLHFRVLCLAVGAAVLFAIARANRLPIRVPPGAWPRLIVITLFNVAAWNVLAVYGVTFMESGRAAILAYTFPVWGVLLGVWVLREPVTGRRLVGVVLGVLGMLVLLGDEIQAVGRSPTGALLLIASAISWAVSTAIMKRWPVDLPTTSFTGWQMLLALAPVLSGALLFEDGSFSPLALSTWPFWGLVYNALVSSIFCNWAWIKIATHAPISVVDQSTLMIPIVGVFSGMLLLGEHPQWSDLVALVLVVAALAVVLLPHGPAG